MIPCAPLHRPVPYAMSKPLSSAQNRYLRGLAHHLKPVIQMGAKGLSDSLIAELDIALEHHELVKVKIAAEDREAREAMATTLAERSEAHLIQRIGNIASLYRPRSEKPDIVLPR